MMDHDAPPIAGSGYRRPPQSTRFRKGQSGNPKGRPPNRHRQPPHEALLGQIVTIRDGGVERQVNVAEAFLLTLAKQGLEGDGAAARATFDAIMAAKAQQPDNAIKRIIFVTSYEGTGRLNMSLEDLRMGRRLDPSHPTVRMVLEPWIVQAALARLGTRRLTLAEQKAVIDVTRAPQKVRWPEWWNVREGPTSRTSPLSNNTI